MPFLDPEYLQRGRYQYPISILQREKEMLTHEYERITKIRNSGHNKKSIDDDLTIALRNIEKRLKRIEDAVDVLTEFNIKLINS